MGEENKHSWMCRVCLEPREMGSRSIHEKYKDYCIMEYVNKLTAVNIKSADGLPDRICGNCFLELDVALNFIEKCEKSDSFLRNHYKSLKTYESKATGADIKNELDRPEIKLEEIDMNEVSYVGDDDFEYFALIGEDNEDQIHKQEPEIEEGIKKGITKQEVECHDCGALFRSKCKLRVHWKNTHMLNALVCSYCKRKFKSYRAFNSHNKKKSKACATARDPNVIVEGEGKARVFNCKECAYKTRRIKDIESHLRTHSGEKPFLCDLCPKRFSQLGTLQSHNETSHKQYTRQITCQYCGKMVKGRGNVYRHLRAHRQAAIQCPICQKPIKQLSMAHHMKRHTGVKTCTCEICAATFYSRSELCNHKRVVHIKPRTYKCQLCDYKAHTSRAVIIHQSRHTDKNFACDICGRFFPNEQRAVVHRRRHFEEHLECLQCHKKFMKRESLRAHMMKKHCSMVDQKCVVKCESVQNESETITIVVPKL